ncbi:MAG: TadE/TadG family type IV pilus assembly protein [Acidimicrobiales bacterium]
MRGSLSDERGAALIETVLVMSALLLLLGVTVAAGRILTAKSAVLSVAREAARVAVEQASAQEALRVGREIGDRNASGLGLDPARMELFQDASDFGPRGQYVVVARYMVSLGDVPSFGLLPRSLVVEGRHVQLIDPYRGWPPGGAR